MGPSLAGVLAAILAAVLWLSGALVPALAGEDKVGDAAMVAACVEAARNEGRAPVACIGAVSDACLDLPDNVSTQAMVACIDRETVVWDGRLNSAYQILRRSLPREAAAKLLTIQRAWIAYKEAACPFAWDVIQGTMAYPMIAACVRDETARRALELESYIELGGG